MRDVMDERKRQFEIGWTREHDDEHTDESIAQVASVYALPPDMRRLVQRKFPRDVGRSAGEKVIVHDLVDVPENWPSSWHGAAYKPKARRQDLVRAAALLVAEIERLDRAHARARLQGRAHA